MSITNGESGLSVRTELNLALVKTDFITVTQAVNLDTIESQLATQVANNTGTNTGDQTTIVGITGTKAQFDTAVTDGNFVYSGDSIAWSVITGTPITLSGYGITDAQPLDTDLTTLAGLTATTDNFIVSVASAWASRTPAQVRTTLALVIGTDVQAFNSNLTTVNTGTQGDILYYSGANALAKLAKNASTTRYLSNTGASNNPAWAQIALATGVSGVLPYANFVNATAASKLVGRGSAGGAGVFEEITIGSGLTMTGTTLSAAGGGGGDMLASTYDVAGIAQQVLGTTATQTITNKTITSSTNVLGGVTLTLGSDADGDTYYRAGGVLTRIPKGTAGQVWTMNGGATAPEWATGGGGSGDMLLAGSQVITGYFDSSYAGTVSRPALAFTGLAYAAGDATTNKALVLIQPTGATSTGWSTAGTYFGVNAQSGFTGRVASFQINAVEKLGVGASGIHLTNGTGTSSPIRFSGGMNIGATDTEIKIYQSSSLYWSINTDYLVSVTSRGPHISRGAGTTTVPVYTFAGNTNTGMGLSATSTLELITNSLTALQIDSNQVIKINCHKRVTTQYDATTTTLGNVNQLTMNVLAAGVYRFSAKLHITADATGGVKLAMGGTCTATSIKYQINVIANTTNALAITSRQTALAGAAAVSGDTSYWALIEGLIVVNAAGTLTVQFAENVATGTSSVLTDSTYEIWGMT